MKRSKHRHGIRNWKKKPKQLICSIKQKATKCVEMAVVITQEAAGRKNHIHLVPCLHLHCQHGGSAVLLVLRVVLTECCNHETIFTQTNTGSQEGSRGTCITIHCKSQRIDPWAWDRKDTCTNIVAVTQVNEYWLVLHHYVISVGSYASPSVSQRHWKGTAAGWGDTEAESVNNRGTLASFEAWLNVVKWRLVDIMSEP